MKLSFSTKGWHNSTFEEFCKIAKDLKFKGIELHNIHNRLFTDKDGAFHDYAAAATVRKLYEMKLSLPCIDSICNPAEKEDRENSIKEILECITIASNLKIPYVRLRCQGNESRDENIANLVNVINAVLPKAEEKNVTLLIETCGIFCDTAALRDLLDSFACDNLAALWDMYSPYFLVSEQPETTIKNLGAYIRHVHIKDAIIENGETEFCLIGEGTLPVEEMMMALLAMMAEAGISEETARELAKFRLNEQKPKAQPVKEESEDSEETAARLREVEMFQANHPELPALPNEVIELWEKSGISLEKAFEGFQNKNKVEELEKKIAALEKENMKKEQKVYAKETSPGSANSAAGKPAVDPFVEGLFAKY